MQKLSVLAVTAIFVAAVPAIASAKSNRHHRHHHRAPVVQEMYPDNAGPRLVANALHQLIVPFEVTFGPRRYQ